jgi:hypothetical protein
MGSRLRAAQQTAERAVATELGCLSLSAEVVASLWPAARNEEEEDSTLATERLFARILPSSRADGAVLVRPLPQFMELVHARARRRFQRGLKRRPMGLIKKLRKAKKECLPNEKPAVVKTHLRDMLVVPEMIGSVVGIYNGKVRPLASGELSPRTTD